MNRLNNSKLIVKYLGVYLKVLCNKGYTYVDGPFRYRERILILSVNDVLSIIILPSIDDIVHHQVRTQCISEACVFDRYDET